MGYGKKENNVVVQVDNKEVKEQITEVDDRLSSQLAQTSQEVEETTNLFVDTVFSDGIFIWAHKGMVQVAPENTIPAITQAKKYGFKGVEIDIQETSDGVPVIYHDSIVDYLTDGTGSISDMTLEEVKALNFDAGVNYNLYPHTKIPTLEEALQVIKKENLYAKLHVRWTDPQNFLDLINKYQLSSKVMVTAGIGFLTQFRALNKTIHLSYGTTIANLDACIDLGNCSLGLVGTNYTVDDVNLAHSYGVKVSTDTCYSLGDYQSIKEKNVDMIVSDILITEGVR